MLQPTDVGRRGTSQWKIAVCESVEHKDKGIANSSETVIPAAGGLNGGIDL